MSRLVENFIVAALVAWCAFWAGRSYELKQPKNPEIVAMEAENLRLDKLNSFMEGQNAQLEVCNQILESLK